MNQKEYLIKIADRYYSSFFAQGHATAGHNGPHGHLDTPVRNTGHYLIIYSFLYKHTHDEKYLQICKKFADYLIVEQQKSKSGAIQCMVSDKFDHLNGLIGQGWTIEALLYYYSISKDDRCLQTAHSIYRSQYYDEKLHLWHRIELDGSDIGIDPTYNHHVWFAACSYPLAALCQDKGIDNQIRDFLTEGAKRDFRIHHDGLLKHHVNVYNRQMRKTHAKNFIKTCLAPFSFLNQQKLNPKYMEYAYHIFDMYGFCILKEHYGELPIFSSPQFFKAVSCAQNIHYLNKKNGVYGAMERGRAFNPYGYSYNAFAFEYPYVAKRCGFYDEKVQNSIWNVQKRLMFDVNTGMFTRNQPDIETWNARTYEIIRFLEA